MRSAANWANKLAAAFFALLLALPPQARAQQLVTGGSLPINSLPGLPLNIAGGGTGATSQPTARDNIAANPGFLSWRTPADFGAKCDVTEYATGTATWAAG